jgi:hypothetical protein
MVEFISYSLEDFMGKKDKVICSPEVKSRYETLFQSAECFFSTGFVSKPFPSKPKPRGHHLPSPLPPSASANFRRPYIKPVKKINPFEKTHIKKVKCILNVINASNYLKQFNKMKFVMENDNITDIVPLILETGVIQIFYINIFINLLVDIAKNYRSEVESYVNQFVRTFLDSRLIFETANPITPSNTDYDVFCATQKQKSIKISTGIMILNLINAGFTKIDIATYVETLISICNENKNDELMVDTILQILVECKKLFGSVSFDVIDHLKSFVTNSKSKFLVDSLL